MSGVDLLALIGRDTVLRRSGSQKGGEYSGPCPLCRTGYDRFKVWPHTAHGEGRWACLGPTAGRSGCDKGGDAVQYLRERDGLSYPEASARLGLVPAPRAALPRPPSPRPPSERRRPRLLPPPPGNPVPPTTPPAVPPTSGATKAPSRAYLHTRGLFDSVLRSFQIGYNPTDVYEDRTEWGLPDTGHKIWLPRGITFPWRIGSGVWRLNIRRPLTPSQAAAGEAKYIGPAGYGSALYNADALAYDRPAVLVEGEIDAITIAQACPTEVAAVATGSTAGARRPEWIARLAQASVVLLAFDVDPNGAGDQAAAWWQARLPRAKRLRPLDHDVNSLPEIETVRAWLMRALARD